MRLSLLLIACSFLSQTPWNQTQGGAWRGIKPLRSTRADVEKLLGSPTKPEGPLYETEQESVVIDYSAYPCEDSVAGRWNVPPDTVIRVEVRPKKDVYFKELHLDESRYRKVEEPHISGLIAYVNDEDGVLIKVRYEKVLYVSYGPATNDKNLACPTPSSSDRID